MTTLCRSSDAPPSPTGSSGETWTRDGLPRCGYMVTIAAIRACKSLPGGCSREGIDVGIVHEMAIASVELGKSYKCVASPIVLDLDGRGLSVVPVAKGPLFDLNGLGSPMRTAWVQRGKALLAMDRDGDGRISDGTELFGEATPSPSGVSEDGFEALRALDANRDGVLDARDPGFGRLLVWRDDGDGVSQRGELSRLDDAHIARIDLAASRRDVRVADGSVLSLWSRFVRTDGSTALAVDVFFRTAAGR